MTAAGRPPAWHHACAGQQPLGEAQQYQRYLWIVAVVIGGVQVLGSCLEVADVAVRYITGLKPAHSTSTEALRAWFAALTAERRAPGPPPPHQQPLAASRMVPAGPAPELSTVKVEVGGPPPGCHLTLKYGRSTPFTGGRLPVSKT